MRYKKVVLSAFATVVLAGCAHNATETAIDDKLAKQPEVSGPNELRQEAAQLIDKAPGLTPEQKQKLAALRANLYRKGDVMREESLKLRSLIIKEVASPNYNDAELSALKGRLKSNESDRLTLLFDSVDKANEILGRETARNHPEIFRDILDRGGRM